MASYRTAIIGALLLCYLNHQVCASNITCGDWNPYNNEKCIKIFEEYGFVTYPDAVNICEVNYEAHLITIGSEEEQRFIEGFLNSSKVTKNAWIGLEYKDNAYQWADDTPLRYTHWADGSPANDPNQCAQIQTAEPGFGYWSDNGCMNKNILICEKVKLWSPIELQMKVMKLMNNPVPVGFTYAQLPKERPPTEIWPWMEWTDVSNDYEGVFFRVLGGEASSFGEVQEGNSPRLTRVDRVKSSTYGAVEISANGEPSPVFDR